MLFLMRCASANSPRRQVGDFYLSAMDTNRIEKLGLTPIATSTLAGVIVSVLGTLLGMIALYDLVRDELEDAGGIRAGFYLIARLDGL